jgi:hypothetical protein
MYPLAMLCRKRRKPLVLLLNGQESRRFFAGLNLQFRQIDIDKTVEIVQLSVENVNLTENNLSCLAVRDIIAVAFPLQSLA